MENNIKHKGFIDDKFEEIFKEFKSSISVFYILLVGIGMLFSYNRYKQFGINIFEYSEVFDYLIAPFRDIVILLVTFMAFLLVFIFYQLDLFTKKKYPAFYNSKFNWGLMKSNPIIGITLATLICLIVFSNSYGAYKKRNLDKAITVELLSGEIKKGKLIGKNNSYVFLLTKKGVEIIPVGTAVKMILLEEDKTAEHNMR